MDVPMDHLCDGSPGERCGDVWVRGMGMTSLLVTHYTTDRPRRKYICLVYLVGVCLMFVLLLVYGKCGLGELSKEVGNGEYQK
jgi:hypothetical protein